MKSIQAGSERVQEPFRPRKKRVLATMLGPSSRSNILPRTQIHRKSWTAKSKKIIEEFEILQKMNVLILNWCASHAVAFPSSIRGRPSFHLDIPSKK
jgi:hypothetical protein